MYLSSYASVETRPGTFHVAFDSIPDLWPMASVQDWDERPLGGSEASGTQSALSSLEAPGLASTFV